MAFITDSFTRLAMEPPLRVLVRAVLRLFPTSVSTRVQWEISRRPVYLLGVYSAAIEAEREGVGQISVIEFGVAGGSGLVTLQDEAAAVEAATGIGIKVYGFDAGAAGLPSLIGDHRDHPDAWRPGDYPMNEALLRSRLTARTSLIIGDVQDTVPDFFQCLNPPPVGFVAVDLDLYSSTRAALEMLAAPGRRMLRHVPMYFDDVDFLFNHRFAGELLAIEEFNTRHAHVKIDRWHGVRAGRPFPERGYFDKLYVAHDLAAIASAQLARTPVHLPLEAGGRPAAPGTTRETNGRPVNPAGRAS